MRDVEFNALIDDEAVGLTRAAPRGARLIVREGYLGWCGPGSNGSWEGSPLWPAAIHYARLMVAPEAMRPEIYEALASEDAIVAIQVLTGGIRFDHPEGLRYPCPPVSAVAAARMLACEDREWRERAIAQLPRPMRSA